MPQSQHQPSNDGGVYVVVTRLKHEIGIDVIRRLEQRSDTRSVYVFSLDRPSGSRQSGKVLALWEQRFASSKVSVLYYESPSQVAKVLSKEKRIDACFCNNQGMGLSMQAVDDVLLPIARDKLVETLQLAQLINEKTIRFVVSGSEVARGLPEMGYVAPKLEAKDNMILFMNGAGYDVSTEKKKLDIANVHYAYIQAMLVLLFGAMARRNPQIHFQVISPGFTPDSLRLDNIVEEARTFSFRMYLLFMRLFFPVLKAMGVGHDCSVAGARFVQAMTGDENWKYPNGTLIAAMQGTSGPIGDQSLLPDGAMLRDKELQEKVYNAVNKFC